MRLMRLMWHRYLFYETSETDVAQIRGSDTCSMRLMRLMWLRYLFYETSETDVAQILVL